MSSRTQGIHNSETIDDLRDIDPSVKQTSRVGTIWPSMATSSKLQLTAVAECGGQQEGRGGERSLPDPFNYTSCSVADSYSSQTEGDGEFKDLLFIRAQSLGTTAEAEAQASQETAAGVGKLGWSWKTRQQKEGPSHQSRPPSPELWSLCPYLSAERRRQMARHWGYLGL